MGFLTETEKFKFPRFLGVHFLSDNERSKLAILFDALFPPKHINGTPGAVDAKAHEFVSYLLGLEADAFHMIPEWRSAYREGLIHLDAASVTRFGKELQDLSAEEANTILTDLENNDLKDLPGEFNQRIYFRMLLDHCIKGCFCDPRWGGNSNGIMWRWLGWVQPAEDIRFEAGDQ